MTCAYAVTFEFDTRPPLTLRGTVPGSSGATCAARAMREAQRVLRPVKWTSCVCVLLGRADEATAEPTTDEAAAATN